MKPVQGPPVSLLPPESAHHLLCNHRPGHPSRFRTLPGDVGTEPRVSRGLTAAVPSVGSDTVG